MTLDEAPARTDDAPLAAQDRSPPRGGHGAAAPASLVLFVGPDLQPSRAACETLVREGMRSLWVRGLPPALQAASLARFDAAVIDVPALGRRGVAAALVALRAALQCPLIVVAPLADEIDEIVALELGASAYLVAPVTPRRLRAHLSAAMRRHAPAQDGSGAAEAAQGTLVNPGAGWQVDRVRNELRRGTRRVSLTDVQCALLQCLVEARGLIVPRLQLAAALPQVRRLGARTIDVYIHRLRQRLDGQGVDDLRIAAVRGRGYQLSAVPG
jgi:DNA-binding response OmpR family regulator